MTENKDDFLHLRITQKRRKKFRKMGNILNEWYGYDRGAVELSGYLPKTVEIKDVLDDILAKNLGPKEQKLMELKKNWERLMGEQIAKISAPVSLKNNILKIEVENSAWLMELKNFHGRLVDKKVKEFCGGRFCYKIIYALKGARPQKQNFNRWKKKS